jgi:NAD(P) transhydrogenase subunit beta
VHFELLQAFPLLLAEETSGILAPAVAGPLQNWAYLLASILFIFGIKGMTHPRTAVRGNLLGALGMLIALVVTLLMLDIGSGYIYSGLVVGAVLGYIVAVKVQMTQMPQMVGLLNGFGGAASVFVAWAEVFKISSRETVSSGDTRVSLAASAAAGLIGAVTLTGSLIASGKLQEMKIFRKPWIIPGQVAINGLLLIISIVLSVVLVQSETQWSYVVLVIVASTLGVLLVCPIGGADMPVAIALLNSYSGLAASATGFVIGNNVLIVAGALVGASGIILTQIMCKAMNRSLTTVLFGAMGPTADGPSADDVYAGKIKSTSSDEVAMLLDGVQRVVIVPGYGLAVAQAQHTVRDLATILQSRGVTVEYAIHPVAGRMPGHMNVLLAEADVPYEQLKEMDEINPTFAQCDVAIVIGANDVVNPVARTDPHSPIAGMPILNVDQARTVVVIKRSLSPGYAGIPNPLFAADNCLMLFGDGKKALVDLVAALKEN